MSDFTNCPQCNSEYTYEDGELLICPECAHEWSKNDASHAVNDGFVVKDANGNVLQEGDTVTVIKDLKVKGGGNFTAKRGTTVRNISLVFDNIEHIEGRVEGVKIIILTKYVKK